MRCRVMGSCCDLCREIAAVRDRVRLKSPNLYSSLLIPGDIA